eukprot:3307517-Amphidinium_carterae.1
MRQLWLVAVTRPRASCENTRKHTTTKTADLMSDKIYRVVSKSSVKVSLLSIANVAQSDRGVEFQSLPFGTVSSQQGSCDAMTLLYIVVCTIVRVC